MLLCPLIYLENLEEKHSIIPQNPFTFEMGNKYREVLGQCQE
jgi:hypothetical protein